MLTYEEVLDITKANESFKMKHQMVGDTEVAMCTYFLASPEDFFDAKLDGSMINAQELRGITFTNFKKQGWKTHLFMSKWFNIGETNGTNNTNMVLTINGEKQVCNINKLYSNDGLKVWRAIDLKVGMTVGEFDRATGTVGKLFKIETLEKEVLNTEKPENSWMYNDVKDLEIARIVNKEDGSCIRFLMLNGELVAKTKFSLESEQAIMAMDIVNKNTKLKEFIIMTLERGYAALFELVSPFNKIVLSYPDTRLRLLQLRDENNDGEYLDIYKNDLVAYYDIEVADLEPLYTLDELLALKATVKNKEGWVITFKNGKMAKIKTDWYLSLHGLLSDGLQEHKIIEKVLNSTIDDVLAQIPEENIEERNFINGITKVIVKRVNHITSQAYNVFKSEYNGDRKAIAMKFKGDNLLFPFIMHFVKGKTYEEVEKLVMKKVQFECRKLEVAKTYLRKLGFTTELKQIEDNE